IKLSLVQSLTGPALVDQLGRPPRSAVDGIISPDTTDTPETPEVLLEDPAQPVFSAPSPQQP
ncbi:MAG: hypothetical protein AAFX51_13440, partial [Cyanobacteria bacterium J06636_28]